MRIESGDPTRFDQAIDLPTLEWLMSAVSVPGYPLSSVEYFYNDDLTRNAFTSTAITRVHAALASAIPPEDAGCVALLLDRLLSSRRAIARAAREWHSSHRQDLAPMMRSLVDRFIQLIYIVHDDENRPDRVRDYLDFRIVEQVKFIDQVLRQTNPLAQKLSSSPLRVERENEIRAAWAQVVDRYRDQNERIRKTWYRGDLASLAREIDFKDEYLFFVSVFHPIVHSSCYGLQDQGPVSPRYVPLFVDGFACRALLTVSEIYSVMLDPEDELILRESAKATCLDDLPF